MPYVYIGRTHDFIGKSIWEIACSLKDFGVGRMVIKQRHKRYSEPCFMRIVSAKPQMDEDNRKGEFIAEHVFRGHNLGHVNLSRVAYKTDYQLIPKHEEYKYLKATEEFNMEHCKIFAPTAEMPPLLKLVAEKKGHHSTVLKMSLQEKIRVNPRARVAKEGETPNAFAQVSLGTPVCSRLYEGVLDAKLPEIGHDSIS